MVNCRSQDNHGFNVSNVVVFQQNMFRRGAENRDSMSSQVTSSSDDLFREYNV